MATDVLSLFNMPTQEQLGRSYLEGMLTSPQQMGAQSLLQQVVSLGGNAGAGIGYGVGRLMGGMTADEVRAKSIDDAMRTVQGMGLTSDAEMYGALSQELARRGLTQDALKARDVGLKAAQTEQSMKTEQARLGIAQQDLQLKQAQDKREAELAPFKRAEAEAKAEAARRAVTSLETRLGQAAEKEQELRASAPNSPEHRRAIEDVTALSREYQDARNNAMLEIQKTQAQIAAYEAQRQKALSDINYNTVRAAQDAFTGKLVTQYRDTVSGRTESLEVGKPSKGGKIQGLSSGKIYTMDEWSEGGGYIKEANAIRKANNLPELGAKADTGGDNKGGNKNIKGVLESIYSGGQAGQQQPVTAQTQAPVATASLDQALEKELEEMRQGNRLNFSPEVGAYYKQRRAEQRRQEEEAYLAAERQRQLRGQR